jgi:hypothetical protein
MSQPQVRLHQYTPAMSSGSLAALPARSPRGGRILLILLLLALAAICAVGAPYYLAPIAARVRSPLHPWLKPSGFVGQSAGILALVLFLFLWLYPLRKKFRWLSFTGALARWLNTHVLAALGLPLLVAVHAAWRFRGVIGLGFWSMMLVWLSGIVGRYLYARIPRSRAGVELTIDEITVRRTTLLDQIARQSGLPRTTIEAALLPATAQKQRRGLFGTLMLMVADDFARWAAERRLRRLLKRAGPGRKADRATIRSVLRLANREIALEQQVRMLDATHAVFRYWHVLHRPVAFAALVAVLVHVAVVVALGATWLW